MSLTEFFTLNYWFTSPAMSSTLTLKLIFGFFLLLLVVGVGLRWYFKKADLHPVKRKLVAPLPGKLMRWGVVGMLLAFFRFEGVYYLSWRFWWLVFGAWIIFSVVKYVRWYRAEYPKRMALYERRNVGKEWEVKPKAKKKNAGKRK